MGRRSSVGRVGSAHQNAMMVGIAHPDMERLFTSKIFHFLSVFATCFRNALVRATSTMHQSDIRRLVSTKRPEPTLICYVKRCAFYGREYRTSVAAHIGWSPIAPIVPTPKALFLFFLQITLSSFSHCLRQQIEAVRKTCSRMDGILNAKEPYIRLLV